ncbi:MAG: flagellar basal body rod protein FlgC [Candidatus Anammoxibacter sp.]
MGGDSLFSIMDIATTGLVAERMRMNVIANNIANINTTKMADGKPFRRKFVIFTSDFQKELQGASKGSGQLGGVRIKEIKTSNAPFEKMYIPGHPDADKEGFVLASNVKRASEMMDLMMSSRAYEANLAIMRSAQRMINKSLQAFNRQ